MKPRRGRRGQPLLLFGAVLGGWLALRFALWESPFVPRLETRATVPRLAGAIGPSSSLGKQRSSASRVDLASFDVSRGETPASERAVTGEPPDEPAIAPGHTLLLATGLPPTQLPAMRSPSVRRSAKPAFRASAAPAIPAQGSRWSADGWLLLRRDGAPGAAAPVLSDRPSYGRSQMGAVVRYDLAPGSPVRPRVHLRGAAALSGTRERELAAGFSLRPLAGVPLRVAVEARVSETETGTHVRPAVYTVTELPAVSLPLHLRGDAYAQVGYVGGDFATAFVDGQARVARSLGRIGMAELSAGAGAWGGAQKGSARLDVGPTLAVAFPIGEAQARLAADYRFRVAGDAEPESGPALTVSAGF